MHMLRFAIEEIIANQALCRLDVLDTVIVWRSKTKYPHSDHIAWNMFFWVQWLAEVWISSICHKVLNFLDGPFPGRADICFPSVLIFRRSAEGGF